MTSGSWVAREKGLSKARAVFTSPFKRPWTSRKSATSPGYAPFTSRGLIPLRRRAGRSPAVRSKFAATARVRGPSAAHSRAASRVNSARGFPSMSISKPTPRSAASLERVRRFSRQSLRSKSAPRSVSFTDMEAESPSSSSRAVRQER